ncbi:PREDICTED: protein BASIC PENTACYSTEINE2-like [Nelumbo nucifera]|uniref:GAGA-binding transcriptional activator n=1 Tax=Nelumbo nucifera TaxID=4432 RepID=A0A1U8ASZ1_NELNU|nr:PREDICTED: protein BASIC PENTACYSTEINE2-like [Nelumbo nucifera]XP_010271108.1 PREDICTED: protein BASIC PENTACYSTEINE2-like [Nelumbo nucifera]XP_010271109.1 PREDICTED: protein BASIC PENTACYSTEINE2-like [Nelumbo nucifera]
MDDDGLNIRNWGYYEPQHLKGHLGLQLMSTVAERDTKAFFAARDSAAVMVSPNGAFHPRDCGVSEAPVHMDYMKDSWATATRERLLHMMPGNPNFAVLSEASAAHHPLQILQPPDSSKDERVARMEDSGNKKEGPLKKRQGGRAQKSPKAKKPKRVPAPKDESNSAVPRAKAAKKSTGVVINGVDMDISGIPIPVCSCTGTPQQCYRWGCGGWQSACCTTSLSMYPLPMSTKRRGARIAGRKMSQGAFKKVLEKLVSEGYNLSNPIDLRPYWAKHGTNKFVTIR